MLRGRKATLHFASSQNRVELKPEAIFTEELEAEEFADAAAAGAHSDVGEELL